MTRRILRYRSALLALVVVALLVVAGCGGGKKDAKKATPEQAGEATTTVAPPPGESTTVPASSPPDSTAAPSGDAPPAGNADPAAPAGDEEAALQLEEAWYTALDDLAAEEDIPVGATRTHDCPAGGDVEMGWVYGTDTYDSGSAICVAAVHAGVITPAAGGRVTVRATEGLDSYKGSTRNGVTSEDGEAWSLSFVFVR